MSDIVISEFMDKRAVAELADRYDVLYEPEPVERPEELLAAVRAARALIVRNRTQVRGELLDAGASLRVIGRLGVGLDNIDMRACDARGIKVVCATNANVMSVAEYVIVGIFLLLRRAYLSTSKVLAGEWPRTKLIGHEISGKTLGLVGFGTIARAVAERATALGMHVIAHDPFVEASDSIWHKLSVSPRDLKDVLTESDAVSLHVPLSADTQHLINADGLKSMKRGAVLINASRGGVVDEHALVEALCSGGLKGAMLDVFEDEPLPPDSHLVDVPNLILTPHIAGVTEESNERVSAMVAANVRRILEKAQ
ncbi:MAG: hydroxyacid dehydrogenase [Acidiferrobacterales bacterium]